MALQTQDFSAEVRSINNANIYVYTVRVTENSVNDNANTSNVTVQLILKCTTYADIFYLMTMSLACSLNGNQIIGESKQCSCEGKNQENVFASWTGDVSHNADGSLALSVESALTHSHTNGWMPVTPITVGGAMSLTSILRGLVYIDNGTGFAAYECHLDNGTGWDRCIPYKDNGSGWDMCG